MAPPSPLAIKTSSVTRLTREEASYHREQATQTARLQRMIDAKADVYEIKQQTQVVKETKEVLPAVREKLKAAVEVLGFELEGKEEDESEEVKKARKAVEDANAALAVELTA